MHTEGKRIPIVDSSQGVPRLLITRQSLSCRRRQQLPSISRTRMLPRAVSCWIGFALASALICGSASAHEFLLGVDFHFMNYPRAQSTLLNVVQEIGFNSIRVDALWSRVEVSKGVYKIPSAWDQLVAAANRRGIQPVMILDYGNKFYDGGRKPVTANAIAAFKHYAEVVVTHFSGKVRYYEIWNEWNTWTGVGPRGTPSAYARLFNAVLPAIKKADPAAVVMLSSGYGNWYKEIAKAKLLKKVDAISVHVYDYANTGTRVGGVTGAVTQVTQLEANLRRWTGRKEVALYVTEIGWPTNTGQYGLTESRVAAFAEGAFLKLHSLPYVQGIWWYDLVDGPNRTRTNDQFGLLTRNFAYKRAATTIRKIARHLTTQPCDN